MTVSEVLERLLKSYRRYYNVKTEDVTPPFAAEAAFHSHDEQFFLIKSARLAEADSHEYVFFAVSDLLEPEELRKLDETAWETGLSRVKPHWSHRSTDVVLIVLAERIAPEAASYIAGLKRYQSYRHTLQGWSSYQVIAMETSTGRLVCNRRGRDLKKLFRNIKL